MTRQQAFTQLNDARPSNTRAMTNSPIIPPLPAHKTSARTALSALRTSGHPLGSPLALCLMFESARNQVMAASVFELAICLDAALCIPREPMLAAIRIQWWADALDGSSGQKVALLAQLQVQFQIRPEIKAQIQDLIHEWLLACHEENRDSTAGWAAACRLVAIQLGHIKASDQAEKIGHILHQAARESKQTRYSAGISADINSLRRNDWGDAHSWLYLMACLNQKLQGKQAESSKKKVSVHLDDPGLIWRILCWYFFGPPQ